MSFLFLPVHASMRVCALVAGWVSVPKSVYSLQITAQQFCLSTDLDPDSVNTTGKEAAGG